ncbi:MAG: hypothetical protein M3247_05675, partial [Thermoproteota archaeon]|nr:hypothetical protein [Thermoproteota archaeon]
ETARRIQEKVSSNEISQLEDSMPILVRMYFRLVLSQVFFFLKPLVAFFTLKGPFEFHKKAFLPFLRVFLNRVRFSSSCFDHNQL